MTENPQKVIAPAGVQNDRKPKVSKKCLKESIEKNFGIMTLIARELRIDRKTVKKYIARFELSKDREEQREKLLDVCENNIVATITGGTKEKPVDYMTKLETTKWYLERQGRTRGYGNRQVNVNIPAETDERTDEQIRAEIERLDKENL